MTMTESDEGFRGTCPTCGQRDLAKEIERLQEAKRAALKIADERSKENVALRAALSALKSEAGALALLRELTLLVDFEMGWEDCGCFPRASEMSELCKRVGAFIADQSDKS